MRAAEWAAWTRTLPWRVAVIFGIGAGGGVLGNLLAPRLSLVVGGLAAVVAGWGLRFKPSSDAVAWRRGAVGERRTARLLGPLERQGWVVLHDLAVPGSGANIDHAGVAPIPVSSGRTDRHRLCRSGNRQLNAALHRIAITQLRLPGPGQPPTGGVAPRATAPATPSARSSDASPAPSTSSSSSPSNGYKRLLPPPLDRGAT